LSINNLASNIHQHTGNIPETHSLYAHLDTVLGRDGVARWSLPIKNRVKMRTSLLMQYKWTCFQTAFG
jgi:hypothetical protein